MFPNNDIVGNCTDYLVLKDDHTRLRCVQLKPSLTNICLANFYLFCYGKYDMIKRAL